MYDVVIIGAGISGITAALYLKRANKNVIIIEKNMCGGILNNIGKIKNYPGIGEISGPDFSSLLYKQLKDNKIELKLNTVVNIDLNNYEKIITLKDSSVIKTRYVILATGREIRKLGLSNENKLYGNGLSYCAVCDGPFFKNKDVAVIGSGDSALEESLYLSNLCNKVTIFCKYGEFKCQKYLLDEVVVKNNIEIIYSASISKIEKNDDVLNIDYNQYDLALTKLVHGVFVYVGSSPNIFSNLNLNLNGNFIDVDDNMKTNIDGIYACGDVISKDLYQLITAASDGAIAATSIVKDMNRK